MYLTYRTLYTKQGTGNEPVQVGQHAMRGNKSRNRTRRKIQLRELRTHRGDDRAVKQEMVFTSRQGRGADRTNAKHIGKARTIGADSRHRSHTTEHTGHHGLSTQGQRRHG